MDPQDQPVQEEKKYTADDVNLATVGGAVVGTLLTYILMRRTRGMAPVPMLHKDLARHVCKDVENAILFPTDYGDCILIALKDS